MLQLSRKLIRAVILITLLHSALVLQWSARQGRLALPVYFDDNHSLVDGAHRLEVWQQKGVMAVAQDYISTPPHAPGHAALAAACFAIFGFHEWAPYLSNTLFFALILLALHLALRGIDPWIEISCMVLLAATPIAGLSILEFRSEVNVAELGALGVLLFLTWSRGPTARPAFLAASSLCFAACFFIKPAVFPYTLGLMGLCCIYQLQSLAGLDGQKSSWSAYFLRMGGFVALSILPALPHYILDWHHISGYIHSVAFSSSSIWLRHDDLISGLLFHVTGYPGRIMLGATLKPHLAILLMAIVASVFRRKNWPDFLPFYPLLYFTLGAYLGVAVNPMNQNYFGMTFHWLLLITTLVALSGLVTCCFSNHLPAARAVLGTVAIAAFFMFKFPLSIDFYREKAGSDPEVFAWLQHCPQKILHSLDARRNQTGVTKVWITAYTMINARTLEWYALLERAPFTFKDFYENDWNAVSSNLDWADIVILPEKSTPSLETIIPNAAMAERMIDRVSNDPRFHLVERIGSPHSGPGFQIYAKNPISQGN